MGRCTVCGGRMIGDGFNFPLQCENATVPRDAESDSGPWYCERGVTKPKDQFLTGSSLVIGIDPGDRDIVCLFDGESEVNAFAEELNSDKQMYGDSLFLSVRNAGVNYLCTTSLEFFYRFKAYSGVLARLQLKDKADRVEIAKACLYWDGPKS